MFTCTFFFNNQLTAVFRLSNLDGDWHEFESKALRKENERKDKEARRHIHKSVEKKRGLESDISERDAKKSATGTVEEYNSPKT